MPALSCYKRRGLFLLPSCNNGPTNAIANLHKGICKGVRMPQHKVGFLSKSQIETTGNNKPIFLTHDLPTLPGGVVVVQRVVTTGCLVVEIPVDCELLSTARLATFMGSDFTPTQKVE
jgi:hypothetical protein